MDNLTDHVRETAEFIMRKDPAKLQPLRQAIDAIFRKVIEARAPQIKPADLGKPAQSCGDDDLAIPAFLQRAVTP
jgi:hypothetical protein